MGIIETYLCCTLKTTAPFRDRDALENSRWRIHGELRRRRSKEHGSRVAGSIAGYDGLRK